MVCCWWCCHECEHEPLHLPYKYCEKLNKFYTMGHFCSWSCMKSFNLDHFPSYKIQTTCQNISLLRKRSGEKLGNISLAPSRYALKTFGGPLSIEEFRSKLTPRVTYNLPSDIIIYKDILENKQFTIQQNSTTKVDDDTRKLSSIINSSGKQNQSLKLKRETPLKRDKNNLETTLGLSRKKCSPP